MNKNTNTRIFSKLILEILKIDWLFTTFLIFIIFFVIYLEKEPKCDTNKRIEFMEKCISWNGGLAYCEDISKNLYCTKKFF